MRKKPDYNDLARKWPLPFRNGLTYYSHTFRRLLIYVGGDEEITSEMLEQMKKSDLLFDRIIIDYTIVDVVFGLLLVADLFTQQLPKSQEFGEAIWFAL